MSDHEDRFRAADLLWGPGNWEVHESCPANDGNRMIHAKDHHDKFEKPTGTVTVTRLEPEDPK